MRVLLALDGSPASRTARDLVASIDWPAGTAIAAVTVLEPIRHGVSVPIDAMEAGTLIVNELLDGLRAMTAELVRPGVLVEQRVIRGRPATAIIDEAALLGADVVVLGSRGYGPLRAAMLGSVSTEVAEHAPCPVLIARQPRVSRLLVATDGSGEAGLAVSTLSGWGLFRRLPAVVVGVVPAETVSFVGFGVEVNPHLAELNRRSLARLRVYRREAVDAAAERLIAAGLVPDTAVREGDAAAEIVAAADEGGIDLIVTGTRTLPHADRAVLGSVARKVAQHTTASVLIVRPSGARRIAEEGLAVRSG